MRERLQGQETTMEIVDAIPVWVVWFAAGGVAFLALVAIALMVEAVLDLPSH